MQLDQHAFGHRDVIEPTFSPRQPPRDPLVRRMSRDGVSVSVVDFGEVRQISATAVARSGRTLEEQTQDALQAIEAGFDAVGARQGVAQQSIFMADPDGRTACRRAVRKAGRGAIPATTYIAQRPANGSLVAIEATGFAPGTGTVHINRIDETLATIQHDDLTWIHCAQAVPETDDARVYDRALRGFGMLRGLLGRGGARLEQVVRTWLYLGDIVGPEGPTQRYKELNRARSDVYAGVEFLADWLPADWHASAYPASTGIGADDREVVISGLALATDRVDVRVMPLENPRQTAAFDYAARYSPKSPKFCRAMAVAWGPCATIFISGTASITASETQHVGDPAAQTHETINNIEALISEPNLARHGMPGLGATLENLGSVRVYVKRPEHFEMIRSVCRARLGSVPAVYTIADVCRPDLLVEIEGAAFARQPGSR